MTVSDTTVHPDEAFLAQWSVEFLRAWNALDPQAVAALCTEDVVWCDPSTPRPLVGRDGVSEFVEMTATALPDFSVTETAPPYLRPGTARVLSPYRMTGTMRGPMNGFAPTGRTIAVAGVDDWTFRNGKLCRYTSHYDTLEIARQLGIMPAVGSRAERLMMRVQHAQARVQRRRRSVA
jgi:steroid delta-isomerase-like uncharacterized protein